MQGFQFQNKENGVEDRRKEAKTLQGELQK